MSLRDLHYAYMIEKGHSEEEIALDWAVFYKDYQSFMDGHLLRDEDIEKMEAIFSKIKDEEVPF